MGGAVVIPVIMEIHTDFLCPFQTPDRTLTRRNQMLRDDDIFSKVEQKTNKERRTAPFLSIHLWPGHVTNGYCNIHNLVPRVLSYLPSLAHFVGWVGENFGNEVVIFTEFNWKIVFSKITSRISNRFGVFDKLGLGSKYRGGVGAAFQHTEWKKMQPHRGCPN